MDQKSAKAMNGGALVALVLGMAVMSPAASFLCFSIGVLLAIFPAAFGTGIARLAAIILGLFSVTLAWQANDGFKREMAAYSERSRQHAAKSASVPLSPLVAQGATAPASEGLSSGAAASGARESLSKSQTHGVQ